MIHQLQIDGDVKVSDGNHISYTMVCTKQTPPVITWLYIPLNSCLSVDDMEKLINELRNSEEILNKAKEDDF